MEMPVQKEKKLDDGVHQGTIIDVEYRTEPYAYTDVCIELGDKFVIKCGYPSFIMASSKLGLLLERFGAIVQPGNMIDPNKILVGKQCSFMSISEKKGDKTYARVVPESLKPAVQSVNV